MYRAVIDSHNLIPQNSKICVYIYPHILQILMPIIFTAFYTQTSKNYQFSNIEILGETEKATQ